MKKKIKQKPMIFKLQTKDWNKLTSSQQDKALLFMYRILSDLSKGRKYGYDPDFWAQYP